MPNPVALRRSYGVGWVFFLVILGQIVFYKFEKSLLNLAFCSHPRNVPYHLQPVVFCALSALAPGTNSCSV